MEKIAVKRTILPPSIWKTDEAHYVKPIKLNEVAVESKHAGIASNTGLIFGIISSLFL